MTLTELAERIERAGADEQRELLLEAFIAIYGPKPPRVHGGSKELDQWFKLYKPFFRKLDAEAYLDAAMMLRPDGDGHWPQIIATGTNPNNPTRQRERIEIWSKGNAKPVRANAATLALALTAASLRARSEHDR